MRALAASLILLAACRGVFGIQPVTEQDAADQRCTEGDVCDAPPAPECISDTVLRSYDATGTCTDGQCSYASHDEICAARCESGACVCPVGTDNWPVDVPVATVTAQITVAGAPLTTSGGNIYLRTAAGDELFVGPTSTPSVSFKVVPGIYDVHYDAVTGCGATAPCNINAKLKTVTIPPGASALAIDVPVANVTVNTTVDGAPLTTSTDSGTLSFRTAAGDRLTIGETYVPSTSIKVVAGTYNIHYDGRLNCLPIAPCNDNALLRSVTLAPGPSTINVDVPVAAVTRTVTVGGAPLHDSLDYGHLYLRTAAGDQFALGPTYTASSVHRLVPGTYSLIYERADCLPKAPCNRVAALRTVTIAPGASTLAIDVPVATVTRNVTINGVPITDSLDYGQLYLRTAAGDEVSLGFTNTPSSTHMIAPGTYDVHYSATGASCLPMTPCNANARLSSITIAPGASTINIDVPVATVTRNARIGGLAITDTTDYGNLFLRSATGDELSLGATSTLSSTFKVVAGTYDVHYEGFDCLPITPCNKRAKVQTATIAAGPSTLDIDVPLRVITRHTTVAGTPITSTSDYGALFLRSTKGDELSLDLTYNLSTIHRLVPGTYNIHYQGGTSCAPMTPCNERALLGCVTF